MSENQGAPSSIRVVSEAESDAPGNESEPDDTQVNESMSTGTEKRKREADKSVEQKGKALKKQTSGNEASTSRQQPKQKETKDDGNRVKNIHCKIDRRKKTDKMTDMEVLLFKSQVALPVSLQTPASFDQIRNDWPMHTDLKEHAQKLEDIKAKSNNDVTLDLDELNRELDSLGKQRKELEKDLVAVLDTDKATRTQKEKCFIYISRLLPQDQVQDQAQVQVQVPDQVQDQDQVQENSYTPEGMQLGTLENQLDDIHSLILSTNEEIELSMMTLANEVYDKNNNKVSAKDYEGLEEALDKTNALAPLPDNFKPIAAQIKEARREMEDTEPAHLLIEVFVCAAIKEMVSLQSVSRETLRKWGATLNYARQYDFQVSFADELLNKNLKSYIVDQYISG